MTKKHTRHRASIETVSRRINEYQNYLTEYRGWEWTEFLPELHDILKKHHPQALRSYYNFLKKMCTLTPQGTGQQNL